MRKILILLLFLAGVSGLKAEIPERPVPPKLVNDFAGILSETEYSLLTEKLEGFARETSTQIVVVTVKDLEGYDPGDYAFRVGDKWGVGQKGKENGIVILVKPKYGNDRGRIFIATGYGLEGVLPDATVNGTIVNKEIIPEFKNNNYYRGLDNGITVIMDITRGEYTAEYYDETYGAEDGVVALIIILIFIFITIPWLRHRKRRFYSPGKNYPFWTTMGMPSGGKHSGTFGSFSSGSGSFGGGGFGGFGGGSFGGGGAGGSW